MTKNKIGNLIAFFVTVVVVAVLALLLRGQNPQTTVGLDSPLPTPLPKAPTATITQPTREPEPTVTRPPEPTRRPPTPRPTLGPPTPTPEPLPTLIPEWDTFFYVTSGTSERKSEIYRVQASERNRISTEGMLIHFPEAWGQRTAIKGLYPSPDGRHVVVDWVYGEGGTFVSVIDSQTGRVSPLFGNASEIDQRVLFLDWAPNSEEILVFGRSMNSDLANKLWQVNIYTGALVSVGATHKDGINIRNASFSPEGERIVYAYTECNTCPNELWVTDIGSSDRKLIYRTDDYRIEDVQWSPHGEQIAFVLRPHIAHNVVNGEMWLIEADGGELKCASSVLTSAPELYHGGFRITWSPNGRYVAFVTGKTNTQDGNLDWFNGLRTNVSAVDTETMEVKEMSSFKSALVLTPSWSPQSDELAFMVNFESPHVYQPWVALSSSEVERLSADSEFIVTSDYAYPEFVWLPRGDEK
ncbi:MAG: PD40 domain-containing protein [Caldilineales bacterium]|nr:PD40 domain-containing protein [Caldilineales bacterium]